MHKKSTLLSISIFFLLFIGLSDYGYGCHRDADDNGEQDPHGPKGPCNGGNDDEDTTGGKSESIALIMKFDDWANDSIQSENGTPYVNQEGAGVGASERSQPNPAAGLGLGLNARKNRIERQLDLNITCDEIPELGINKCGQLSEFFSDGPLGFFGSFPTCGDNNFCSLGASVRPYKVSCPGVGPDDPCPDVFTMPDETPELMSFRLSFAGGNLLIEAASAIGGDGALDPGRCLSLLETSQREDFLDDETGTCQSPGDCDVSVTAFDRGNAGPFPGVGDTGGAVAGDDENDAWRVEANGVTALICLRNNNTHTVIGKATLFFGFNAIKKEGATDPFPLMQ